MTKETANDFDLKELKPFGNRHEELEVFTLHRSPRVKKLEAKLRKSHSS
jgi:hypothetical protein